MVLRFRPLLWLTIASFAGLVLLVTLGNWQWSRYQQKLHWSATTFARVTIGSQPDFADSVFVYSVLHGVAGWRVFVPVQSGPDLAFADVAFVPGLQAPREVPPLEPVKSGVWLQAGKPGRFSPKPDLEHRIFYAMDLHRMSEAVGVVARADGFIAANYAGKPNPFVPDRLGLRPERHLGYALTWWGLAAALVGVYLALHASKGRLSFRLTTRR